MSIRVHEIFQSVITLPSGRPEAALVIRLSQGKASFPEAPADVGNWKGTTWTGKDLLEKIEAMGATSVLICGDRGLSQSALFPILSEISRETFKIYLEMNAEVSATQIPRAVVKLIYVDTTRKRNDSGRDLPLAWENFSLLQKEDGVYFNIGSKADLEWAQRVVLDHALKQQASVFFVPNPAVLSPLQLADWMTQSLESLPQGGTTEPRV